MQTTTVLPPGGQQAGAVPMQNVVIMPQYVTSQPEPQVWTNYASKSSLILGATQIAIGLLCILFNAVAIGAHSTTAVVGHGIWGGLFFILTGAFGVMAGKLRTTCSIVTFMVLSILGAVIFVTFVMVLAAIGVAIDHDQGQKSAKAMDAVLLGLSLLEAVVAIWSSALGCSTVCCGRRSQSGIVMQQGPVMMNTGGTQVLYTTGTSYPQTGNMCQQQGIPSAVSQQQQFSSAPMTQVPQTTMTYPPQSIVTYPTQTILTYPNQPTMTYPPQYDANLPPPPYVPTAPQGGAAAAAGSCAPISPVVGEERKIAF